MAVTKQIPFFIELTGVDGEPILLKTSDISVVSRDENGFSIVITQGGIEVTVSETYVQIFQTLSDAMNSVN